MVLDNITGDGFTYGLIKQTEDSVMVDGGLNGGDATYRTQYTLTLRTSKGITTTTSFFPVGGVNTDTVPGAVASGVETLGVKFSTPGNALRSSGTVARDDFDTNRGVRIGNIFVPIAEDVQVYSKALDRFMPLSEARANFTSFQIFCDSDPLTGGNVRVILAK